MQAYLPLIVHPRQLMPYNAHLTNARQVAEAVVVSPAAIARAHDASESVMRIGGSLAAPAAHAVVTRMTTPASRVIQAVHYSTRAEKGRAVRRVPQTPMTRVMPMIADVDVNRRAAGSAVAGHPHVEREVGGMRAVQLHSPMLCL